MLSSCSPFETIEFKRPGSFIGFPKKNTTSCIILASVQTHQGSMVLRGKRRMPTTLLNFLSGNTMKLPGTRCWMDELFNGVPAGNTVKHTHTGLVEAFQGKPPERNSFMGTELHLVRIKSGKKTTGEHTNSEAEINSGAKDPRTERRSFPPTKPSHIISVWSFCFEKFFSTNIWLSVFGSFCLTFFLACVLPQFQFGFLPLCSCLRCLRQENPVC